jgi:hypothetical protein
MISARRRVYTYAQSSEQTLSPTSIIEAPVWDTSFDTRHHLFTEAGISYFNEDLKVGEDKQEAAGRWAVGLDWEVVPKRLKLFHRQEGYYSFVASSVVLRAEQGFRIPLYDSFAANFELDYRFNSDPEASKNSSDLYLILGITYEYAYW